MRYLTIDTIYFESVNGQTYLIKDMREFPEYTTLTKYKPIAGEFVDEIITRKQFYGEGKESLSYRIIEANATTIVENNWNLDKVRELVIPTEE